MIPLIGALATPATAEVALPTLLRVQDVVTLARARRAELTGAKARARAARQRPVIVAALDEPIVALSIDHLPFNGMRVDGSVAFQQGFPLSRVRGHRRRGAEANARRELANGDQ